MGLENAFLINEGSTVDAYTEESQPFLPGLEPKPGEIEEQLPLPLD